MALKSSEVLKGNFSASRRYSSSHPGIDFVCPVTACKSRYNGVIVEVKRNPKGVDWGLFIRVKYNNSTVIGAYAHLSKAIVKVGQEVVKGQIIGYTGNTGYTISKGVVCDERANCGLHLHYSEHTTGKLVWLDPDKENVKQKQVDPMADAKQIFRHVFITVNARWPTSTEINKFLASDYGKKGMPYAYVQKKFMYPNWVKRSELGKLEVRLQDKYEKIFKDQEILYKDLADKLAEEHTLLTKLEAKFDNIQTERVEINELLDIPPEVTQNTRIKKIQGLMKGNPPPAYQQKTPDKWIRDIWGVFKNTDFYKWLDKYIIK